MSLRFSPRGMWVGTALAGVALWLAVAEDRPEATPASYSFTRYTVEQGLPQNDIRALLQTRDGYLWVGTLAGLARFDGLRFKVFDMSNTPEMLSDSINALAEDLEDGSLWIHSGRGLLRYHEHRFERFDEEDGFPQPFGSLWPARQGGLWYSPHPGHLVRLDNRTVRTWELRPRRVSENSDEIVGHQLKHVQEEEDGSLLVLMHIGLFRFLPQTGVCTRQGLPGAGDMSYRHLYKLADGTVFVAAREGLWRSRAHSAVLDAPGDGTQPASSVQSPHKPVPSKAEDSTHEPPTPSLAPPRGEGTRSADEGDNGSRRSDFTVRSRPSQGVPPTGPPETASWERIETVAPGDLQCPALLHPSKDGGFWIAWSEDGPPRLARFQGRSSEFVDLSDLPEYPLHSFCADAEGHLWLGTKSGLCQLRPKAVRVYAREEGLRNDLVRAVTEGPDGTIWLGTGQGASGLRNGQVTNLPPVEPPSNWGWAEGLLADRRGRLWYGAMRNTVVVRDRGAWVSPGPMSLGESWVRTLYEDRSGRIWAGFDRGVLWLDEAGEVQTFPYELSHPDIRVIHQDRRGDMWFGTYGGGLNRLRDGQVTSYKTALGEYNNRAWWIHEDTDGVFWVGTRDGLNRFVPPGVLPPASSTFLYPPTSNLDRNPKPNLNLNPPNPNLDLDPGDPHRFFTFTKKHGLYENTVNNVQEDDFGYLWLSGLQGIYRVARQDLNDVAAGHQARVQVLAFGEADGMLNSECNGGVNQPSGCKDREGRIWFPTVRGVAVVDPRAVRRNEVPPPVVIEQVVADGEIVLGDGWPLGAGSVSQGSTLEVSKTRDPLTPALSPAGSGGEGARRAGEGERFRSAGQLGKAQATPHSSLATLHSSLPAGRGRVVEIRYTANSFAAPKAMRFKYQLEGYDRDWRFDEDNQRVAFYTGLGPGAYVFRVVASNNHGVWSKQPDAFAFSVAPYFWQTWLFYVLAVATAVGLVAAIQAYRLRWQRRLLKVEHQHALADERARIARDLHDDLGTALTGLALQLDVLRRESRDGAARSDRLGEAVARIRALAERMRQVVWAVNPRCDTVSSLASFLEQQAGQFLKADGLRCRLEFPDDIPPLPLDGETRYELALGVREALANAIRHAHASELVLGLSVQADHLIVRVADNGRGFRVAEGVGQGRGLTNMQERLEKIGGQCDCRSAPGAGTAITLRVPLRSAPIPRGPLTP